jgi:trimethylamine--corrinoid protein Co-methyltransferase
LTRFAEAGAKVDFEKQQVWIPDTLVMDSLDNAGKEFTLYGRDLSRRAKFGQDSRNYNSTAGQAFWVDRLGETRRYATIEDLQTSARLGDLLNHINIVGAMADPHELPVQWRCIQVLSALIRSTDKPVMFWFYDRASARYIVEMLQTLRGSLVLAKQHPLCLALLEPISPLRFPFHGVDLLFEVSHINLPVAVGPMAQLGMSAPATMAGTMTQQNAEILAGICITQLIRAGTPVCYGGICHAFDMATTQLIFAGPEQALFGIAMTQLGKFCHLTVYINSGMTDSKMLDAQAGLEMGVTLATGAAAGADIFGHMGICGVDQAGSLDMLIFQDEIISYVESMLREFDFSEDAFGLKEIERVGPGGTFIDSIHTAVHFRGELWFPTLLDRTYYQSWLEAGSSDLAQRCREKKKRMLKEVKTEPLDSNLSKELDRIVAAARRNHET